MRMAIILAVSLLLAIFPLMIAFFFLMVSLPRKFRVLSAEVERLGDGGVDKPGQPPRPRTYSTSDIDRLRAEYFGVSALIIPSSLLTVLYLAGFLLCDSYLGLRFPNSGQAYDNSPWLFPKDFVLATVLSRLTRGQVEILTEQAMGISAIELATAAPKKNKGDTTFANALATKLNVDPVLMAATLDRLAEDDYVQTLWDLWQDDNDSANGVVRIQLPTPQAKIAVNGGEAVSQPADHLK